MQQIGMWQVSPSGPRRLETTGVGLERDLEAWIINDPSLLQAGLTVVASQLYLEQAGILDILALDQQGQWVVVEIKRGTLDRGTVAQAIDYAAAIAGMPYSKLRDRLQQSSPKIDLSELLLQRQAEEEEDSCARAVRMMIVGTGAAPNLQRMIDFLGDRLPVEVILFQVFEAENTTRLLVREVVEQAPIGRDGAPSTLDALIDRAQEAGIGDDFNRVIQAGQRHGLYLHTWKHSVMLAPQRNKSRCLLTVWAVPADGRTSVYVAPTAFAEFYDVSLDQAKAKLGEDGWRKLTSEEVTQLVADMDSLFAGIAQSSVLQDDSVPRQPATDS